jgi:hypothetical protein
VPSPREERNSLQPTEGASYGDGSTVLAVTAGAWGKTDR